MESTLIGQKAPDFTLPTSEGDAFSLAQLDGKWKVIFFYARDGSPTCKRGCLTFKQQYELFQSLTPPVEIVGISQDSVGDHKEFKDNLGLPFAILSDENRMVAKAYGVPLFLGRFPAKSSFVIGPDRTIHYCYDWLFRPRKHIAKILNSLSQISSGDGFQ